MENLALRIEDDFNFICCEENLSWIKNIQAISFDSLLDKCIIEILKRLSLDDLIKMRLVNRKINTVIQRHFDILAKKEIGTLHILATQRNNFVRYTSKLLTRSNEWRIHTELKINELNGPLRHLSCSTVVIEYAEITNEFLVALCRSLKSSVKRLELYNSSLIASFNKLSSILRHLSTEELAIVHCRFPPNFCFNQLFGIAKLNHIHISVDKMTRLNLSDIIISKWIAESRWPRTLLLKNTFCPVISSKALTMLIKEVLISEAGNELLWDFGLLNFTREEFIACLYPLVSNIRKIGILPCHAMYLLFQSNDTRNQKTTSLRLKFSCIGPL
ncbi:hypothetical protein Ddc_08853 [Ditylenchus destructor]|nr:hypothetical protein Ddc_08853 [Ditylenchus destructor]